MTGVCPYCSRLRYLPSEKTSSGELRSSGVLAPERIGISAYAEKPTRMTIRLDIARLMNWTFSFLYLNENHAPSAINSSHSHTLPPMKKMPARPTLSKSAVRALESLD